MKKMLVKTGALMGGIGLMGYMYLKKHPETITKAKKAIKETSKKVCNMMDEDMMV